MQADARERQILGLGDGETATIYVPVGCSRCDHTGYRGRTGIYELIVADDGRPVAAAEPGATEPVADDDVDLDALVDAPPESVKTPIDRLAEAFPGSELVDERD